jgi:Salmonella virulence plasmid 65kDa B protein
MRPNDRTFTLSSVPPAQAQPQKRQQPPVPAITLPKGGGAICGIGEKFAANPVAGTTSMTVPIATSPGRGGFGPQLTLSYDCGQENGWLGYGWGLGLPTITRKTDKGLPRYHDGAESDVFLLSGVGGLVPVSQEDGELDDLTTAPCCAIRRYQSRIEGLFARIEQWTGTTHQEDVHWRSWSRENLLTLYGKDPTSQIYDPADPSRIFSWLICETRDPKGNAVIYCYKAEDGARVDLTSPPERNRGGLPQYRDTDDSNIMRDETSLGSTQLVSGATVEAAFRPVGSSSLSRMITTTSGSSWIGRRKTHIVAASQCECYR